MAKEQFTVLALSEQGNKIAEFMPTGKAWDGKNDPSTNLGQLLLSLGGDFNRLENLIRTVNLELDINFTEQLIREWEVSVGIPDECFGISVDIEVRRLQVITKLRNVRFQTVQDWIALAALFDVTVQVFPGVPTGFGGTDKEKKFSVTVNLPGENSGQVFPFNDKFPIPFVGEITSLMQCLFEQVKPANVRIVFTFGANQLFGADVTAVTSVEVQDIGLLFDDSGGLFDDSGGLFDDK